MSSSLQNSRPRNKNRQHSSSNRGGYQNANSHRRETPELEPPVGVFRDHGTAVMMASIIGTQATVKTANGKTYKGRAVGFSDQGAIALSDAKLDEDDGTPGPNVAGIVIPKDKFVVCRSNGVDLKGSCASDFTDAAIASRLNGNSDFQLRELTPWNDDDGGDPNQSYALDDNSGGWDSESMFQENFERFQLKSSFDENMHEYTTRLPEPGTEAYEAKERFAKQKAEEIERDETYQRRIAKELADHDDDSRFSFVHRDDSNSPHRSHENHSTKNIRLDTSRQAFPPLRIDRDRDRDDHLRNGNMHRGPSGRPGLQRQNSPYSSGASSGHNQSSHHHVHNARQSVNNHYQQGPPPPSSGLASRNQGPPSHVRQHQGPPPTSSQPPPSHHHHHYQQQNSAAPHPRVPPHQQVVSPTQQPQPGSKPSTHLPPSQTVPSSQISSSSPSSAPPPVQNHQKAGSQPPPSSHVARNVQSPPHNVNGISNSQLRHQPPMHVNGETVQQQSRSVDQPQHQRKGSSPGMPPQSELASSQSSGQQQHSVPPPPVGAPPPASSAAQPEHSAMPPPAPTKTSPSPPASAAPAPAHQGRPTRGSDSNPPEEARSKIADLQDFKEKFVLEPPRQEEAVDVPSPAPTGVSQVAPPTASSPDSATAVQPAQSEDASEKKEAETVPAKTSTLNPNAKEFKPKTAPEVTQSPSPQPRSSPQVQHMVHHYQGQQPMLVQLPQAGGYAVMHQNLPRKKATVSLQANVDHLTHQLTGQPLLTTQGPPMPPMMYIQGPAGAQIPAGYQAPHFLQYPQIMGRVPNTIAMTQGQHAGIDQSGAQNQPQPMFAVPAPQQQPIPAHLPHPQPAHAQAPTMQPHQAPTPAHVPNAAPSPVHQQQPPPQSVTPQPTHYINFSQHGAMPRTSTAGGQQNMPTNGISYMAPAPQYTGYQNQANGAQYAAQPQTSQNSNHSVQNGSQPQYVMMPHATPQGHPPIQQHSGQGYPAAGLQFHPQHNLMQGPPHMPPNHGPNPNQGAPHILQHGMQAGIHQQMPGSQPGVFMPMPSAQQLFPHQQ